MTNANQPASESNSLAARLKSRPVLMEFLVSADLVPVVEWNFIILIELFCLFLKIPRWLNLEQPWVYVKSESYFDEINQKNNTVLW